ncbi:hypothetical protein PIB30_020171 [Stylosanthes scabra]|uniref:Uncharacterized protein n=2 Tax=Stylosanthes scabra TaxID=79078 RepID=A0ABU6Q896_9FABA|nr:hypothetical protein [Stylosanthes scabra]
MAAFSVTTTTSSYPPPSFHQPRAHPTPSSSTQFQGSLLLQNCNFGGFPTWRTKRTTLICAVNQDAKQAVQDTLQVDLIKEHPKQVNDNGMEVWSQFAKRVSGEWDGFAADFSNDGKPIELPENVVPEAYREWEVKVFDWQTQCPTLAEPGDRVLEYKSIQLLPTVGCEADAATRYSIDERRFGGADTGIAAFAYQSSGSYVALWEKKDGLLELEYCLISPQDFESRVRIIQHIKLLDNTKMVLKSIRVFCEQWYGPFRNGDQLGGCAIRDSAFATTAPLTASEVAGVWQGSKAVATFDDSNTESFGALLDDQVCNSVRDGDSNILLPKKLWCSLRQNNDGGTLSEVGWLSDHGRAITSSCIFSNTAKLKEISLALETKAEDI